MVALPLIAWLSSTACADPATLPKPYSVKIWIGKPDQSHLEGTAQCDASQDCSVAIGPNLKATIRREYRLYLVNLYGTQVGTYKHDCCDIVGGGDDYWYIDNKHLASAKLCRTRPKNLVAYPCDDYGKIYIKFEDF
ncbi:hypothetical protein J2X72_004483 [Phyllobacterium sp. 1468]|uniref:hypothetical protein n=1 Tax=Phyllobacterium sp. 1468 TaxID=2817759 RepID=UPI00286280BA|nr:hypothetical protein [Phyllobacterium sp. 1468]MDR6635669.1 hypothetical protein [Phyllobacterium sp. 1468]